MKVRNNGVGNRVGNKKHQKLVAAKKESQGLGGMFLERMGLHVDQPRPGEAGYSNEGNAVRRAFARSIRRHNRSV